MAWTDQEIADAYRQGWPLGDIAEKAGVTRHAVARALKRHGVKRDRVTTMAAERIVQLLREEDLDSEELAKRLGRTRHTIEATLTRLRQEGRIGLNDGLSPTGKGRKPSHDLRVRLDPETRMLLDGEAVDAATTPQEIVTRILRSVLGDEELLQAALAA